MTTRKLIALALCAFAAGGAGSQAYAGPVVTNGGFTDGMNGWTVTGGGTTPGLGVTAITTGGSNSTGYGDNVPNYQTGTNAAFFVDDNADETISQQITLTPCTSYTLSYALFATASGAANPYSFTLTNYLSPNYPVLQAFTNQPGLTQVPVGSWTPVSATFTTGAGSLYTLAFNYISRSAPAKDVLLTDVYVPEPASMALLGTGLLDTCFAARRRRRSRAVTAG